MAATAAIERRSEDSNAEARRRLPFKLVLGLMGSGLERFRIYAANSGITNVAANRSSRRKPQITPKGQYT